MDDLLQVFSAIINYFTEDKGEGLELAPWMQLWSQKCGTIGVFLGFLALLFLLMIFKNRVAKSRKALDAVTYLILPFSFIFAGLRAKAQPTTTNLVIIVNGLREGEFPFSLFIMEPYIFLSFLFICITVVLWGRGVFCGWLCPYGAMVELLNRVYSRFFPKFRIVFSEKVHRKLIYLKHLIFAVILGASFYSFMLSEYIAEVEPFKTFVLKLNRQWYFVLYFLFITAGSVVIYRAYCRYLCPLGAALSIPLFIRWLPLIRMKRHGLCSTCRICGRDCSYQAITDKGKVNTRECLDCLECQVNFWNEEKCPALKQKRKEQVAALHGVKGQT